MKKLMIAAAIVCAALASQAAVINWSDTAVSGATIYGPDKTTAINSWATSPNTISAAILMNAADISQSDFLAALRSGTYKDAAFAFGDMKLDTHTVSGSKIAAGKTPELTSLAGTSVDIYYAILATDGDGNKSVLISTLKDGVQVPSAAGDSVNAAWNKAGHTFSAQNYGDAAFGSAGWYSASAVPEPTSGLLLLLGVAGLALRRRRA